MSLGHYSQAFAFRNEVTHLANRYETEIYFPQQKTESGEQEQQQKGANDVGTPEKAENDDAQNWKLPLPEESIVFKELVDDE